MRHIAQIILFALASFCAFAACVQPPAPAVAPVSGVAIPLPTLPSSLPMMAPAAVPAAVQGARVAVVDLGKAIGDTQDGNALRVAIEAEGKSKQAEMETMQAEIVRQQKALMEGRAGVQPGDQTAAAAWEQARQALQARASDLQNGAQAQRKAIREKQMQGTQEILGRVQKILGVLAAERGYSAILNKGAVAYSASADDVTGEVVKRYGASRP